MGEEEKQKASEERAAKKKEKDDAKTKAKEAEVAATKAEEEKENAAKKEEDEKEKKIIDGNKAERAKRDAEKDAQVRTPISMTNHTYWNLSGDFRIKNVRTHRLKLFCDKMVEVDELHNLPQGPLKAVDDTPFDFRAGGEKAPWMLCSLQRLDGAISHGLDGFGIDDQMVINNTQKDTLVPACRLIHHTSRRELNIFTTQPCLQVYTANCLEYP